MYAAFLNSIEKFHMYNGSSMHFALYLAAIVFLAVYQHKKAEHRLMVGEAIAFGIIYLCPVTAYIITKYCLGDAYVYWRMFWMLPMPLIIAYAATVLVGQCKMTSHKLFVSGIILISIILTGSFIVTPQNYDKPSNTQKIPQEAIDIVNFVEMDASKRGIEKIKMVVPDNLLCYVYQYKADYAMPYARYLQMNISDKNITKEANLYRAMNANPFNPGVALEWLINNGCNYAVIHELDLDSQLTFEENGFYLVGQVDGLDIYCNIL